MDTAVTLARAVGLLAASRFLLARRTTTETLRRLVPSDRADRALDPREALIAVRRAGRLVGGKCLPQAVALAVLLQRHGERPVLVLGCLRTPTGEWSAHAWVRLNGTVLEPVTSNRHAELAYLDAATGWVPLPPTSSGA